MTGLRVGSQAGADGRDLTERLRAHLRTAPRDQPVVKAAYPPYDLPNVHLALERWFAAEGRTHELIGMTGAESRGDFTLGEILESANLYDGSEFDEGLGPLPRTAPVRAARHRQDAHHSLPLSRLPEFTAVILSGTSIGAIGPACRLARMLQPALVILERGGATSHNEPALSNRIPSGARPFALTSASRITVAVCESASWRRGPGPRRAP